MYHATACYRYTRVVGNEWNEADGKPTQVDRARKVDVRTVIVSLDVAQLVVAAAILGIYGALVVRGSAVPSELNSALLVIVGVIVGKKLPS